MKTITIKLFPFLVSSLFIFPIIKENFSSLLLILLSLNLILYKLSSKNYLFINLETLKLTLPFWLITVFSIFSSNYSESIVHIKHSLLFLFFPIIFSLLPTNLFTTIKIDWYLKILKNICLIISLIYVFSYFNQSSFEDFKKVIYGVSSFRNYIYYDFNIFVIHPTYYTAILIVCISHSLLLIFNQKKYFELLYVTFFIAITFILLTKLTIVLMIIVVIIMVLNYSKLSFGKKILSVLLTFIIISLLAFYTPGIKERFQEIYMSFNKAPKGTIYDSTNVRKAIFDSSLEVYKNNWFEGVGFENLQVKLNDVYKKNYDSSFFTEINYMTHNYYFYILLSTGLIGFLLFIYYLKNIISTCISLNLILLNVLVFNTFIICSIEDYLYRQHGAFFFNLMLMTLIQHSKNKNTNQYSSL